MRLHLSLYILHTIVGTLILLLEYLLILLNIPPEFPAQLASQYTFPWKSEFEVR